MCLILFPQRCQISPTPSRGSAGVYVVSAFDTVWPKRLKDVRIPIALVEVRIAPRVFWKPPDAAATAVDEWNYAGSRRGDQRAKTLLGGRVVAVVEIVAIERGLNLCEIGALLGALGLVGGAPQALPDDREQTQDQNKHHDFDQGESVLIAGASRHRGY